MKHRFKSYEERWVEKNIEKDEEGLGGFKGFIQIILLVFLFPIYFPIIIIGSILSGFYVLLFGHKHKEGE